MEQCHSWGRLFGKTPSLFALAKGSVSAAGGLVPRLLGG